MPPEQPSGEQALTRANTRIHTHTHTRASILPSASACTIKQQSITLFDLHHIAQYYE